MIKPPEVSPVTGCYKRYTKHAGQTITDGVESDGIKGSYQEHHEYRQMVDRVNAGWYYCIFCRHQVN